MLLSGKCADKNRAFIIEGIQNNEELKEKFNAISDKEQKEQKDYTDEYFALAKEYGIILTNEDFESAEQELSDEDLENVSGGMAAGSIDRAKSMGKMLEEHKKMEEAKRKLANKGASSGQGTETTGNQN